MAINIGSKEAFDALINEPGAVVAIDFWAPWCGPCRTFGPMFDEAAEEIGDAAKFVKVNVDDHQDIASSHEVSSIPTVIYYKDGKIAHRAQGIEPSEDVVKHIKKLTAEPVAK